MDQVRQNESNRAKKGKTLETLSFQGFKHFFVKLSLAAFRPYFFDLRQASRINLH